jgi:hypothetical protein
VSKNSSNDAGDDNANEDESNNEGDEDKGESSAWDDSLYDSDPEPDPTKSSSLAPGTGQLTGQSSTYPAHDPQTQFHYPTADGEHLDQNPNDPMPSNVSMVKGGYAVNIPHTHIPNSDGDIDYDDGELTSGTQHAKMTSDSFYDAKNGYAWLQRNVSPGMAPEDQAIFNDHQRQINEANDEAQNNYLDRITGELDYRLGYLQPHLGSKEN